MKKFLISMCLLLLISGCSKSVYTDEEKTQLEKEGVLDLATSNCEHPETVQLMLQHDFDKSLVKNYCGVVVEDDKGVNAMLKAGLSEEEIKEYQSLSYFREENIDRYLAYEANSIQEKVVAVNMNMDLKPFATTTIIKDDSDMRILINKFNALPEGYLPADLVEVEDYLCVIGEDYSCSTMDKMMLRKEVANAYKAFGDAAKEEGIYIRAIATYRSYAYQQNLYNYNLNLYGQEETDKFYARPGQSEHNSGLAVDITFNGHNYTEIEDKDGYDWILNNMHKYGFILRYPKDKVDITRYGYESWHLRYVGVDVAKTIYENNWTLEEYHAMQ